MINYSESLHNKLMHISQIKNRLNNFIVSIRNALINYEIKKVFSFRKYFANKTPFSYIKTLIFPNINGLILYFPKFTKKIYN